MDLVRLFVDSLTGVFAVLWHGRAPFRYRCSKWSLQTHGRYAACECQEVEGGGMWHLIAGCKQRDFAVIQNEMAVPVPG